MKKIYNTRYKGKEILTLSQITTPEVVDMKILASLGISSESSTESNFSDCFDIEGSDNLCDIRLDKMSSSDLQDSINSTNIDADPTLNGEPRNKQVISEEVFKGAYETVEMSAENLYKDNSQEPAKQETVVFVQDISIVKIINPQEAEESQINLLSEEVVTSGNMDPSTISIMISIKENINPTSHTMYSEKSVQKDSNRLHNQQFLTNSKIDNIVQQIVDNGFIKVTY
ncbi:24889_t:CDS:2, partial [Gigaspora margarita]